jgi:succinate-semialdehyde dehydrogenase/glutarate-semialdehyde dehydrogenase
MAYQTINPATGEKVAEFTAHDDVEVETSLALAHEAYQAWRWKKVADRAKVVAAAAELMRQRSEPLSRLVTLEMGKLIAEARGETQLAAAILDYYAENAARLLAPTKIAQKSGSAVVISQPIGIVFAVEPWNFPYYQLARVIGPNLMTGNPVVYKHAANVPQCADAFAKLFVEAGAPPGLVTNVRISHEQSRRVIHDRRVQGIALTGSNAAGARVASDSGSACKKTTLELGGSDPFIVLADADLNMAIKWGVWSRLFNCGQGCADAKRFIIEKSLYDRFVDGVNDAVEALRMGDPMDAATTLGPVSSESALDTLVDQIDRSVHAGARLRVGGQKVGPGFYLEPAILEGIRPDNPAYREEFFGPAFLMFRVESEAEAISLANDSEFGLGCSIFSEDEHRARRVAEQIDVGMVTINHPGFTAPDLPFGGVKQSGYGRELGELGLQEFVNKKMIRTVAANDPAP